MIEAALAMTTTNNEREAKLLAEMLVKERLAACVQIVPKILSIYEWEKEIRADQEYLLLIKAPAKLMKDVKAAIEKHHSYEVPEFLVIPVSDGLGEYFKWMEANTTK